jgi:hypothetical protein
MLAAKKWFSQIMIWQVKDEHGSPLRVESGHSKSAAAF